MKVLITGGCGFIGSHITDHLEENGYEVVVIDNLCSGNYKSKSTSVIYYEMDYLSDRLGKVFSKEKPDFVIHLAAQMDVKKSAEDPLFDAQVNVIGIVKLLLQCKKYNVKRFVFASTSAVYGDQGAKSVDEDSKVEPISFYGVSKLASEQYIKQFNHQYALPYTIFRYSNVYGPRQRSTNEGGVIPIFLNQLLDQHIPTIYGDGTQTRDFVHVNDVAQANLLALESVGNETMNISSNQTISINELYQKITRYLNFPILPAYANHRKGDILFSQLNNEKAKKVLNWKTDKTLDEGIKELIDGIGIGVDEGGRYG